MAILGLTSFTFYEILIYLYPSVYWYDAHVRLGLRDQILLGHWLPLLQAVIVFISNISLDLVVLRSFFSHGRGRFSYKYVFSGQTAFL